MRAAAPCLRNKVPGGKDTISPHRWTCAPLSYKGCCSQAALAALSGLHPRAALMCVLHPSTSAKQPEPSQLASMRAALLNQPLLLAQAAQRLRCVWIATCSRLSPPIGMPFMAATARCAASWSP